MIKSIIFWNARNLAENKKEFDRIYKMKTDNI